MNNLNKIEYDAIIIGAGACGLMTAVQAGYLGKKTLLLEHNEKVGAKILISGGGRCNYTNLNTTENNFISENEHFVKSAFTQWSVQDTISFFESMGIEGKEKTLGQLFPTSNKAIDIVQGFEKLLNDLNQDVLLHANVVSIKNTPDEKYRFEIEFRHAGKLNSIKTNNVVIATGGLPIPKMGATDFAFTIAKQFDLKITKTAAALVPLVIGHKDREWYTQMSGVSLNAVVSFEIEKGKNISFEENILFTHWGLSGPAILQISSYWRMPKSIYINFLPHHSILKELQMLRNESGSKLLSNVLKNHLPNKLVESFTNMLPLDKKLASMSNKEIELCAQLIHSFEVTPAGDKGYEKAEVMRGGVDTNELSSKTLECKKIKGLYFGGECVDVTGWLGGYNFQWAWASGYVIAQNI